MNTTGNEINTEFKDLINSLDAPVLCSIISNFFEKEDLRDILINTLPESCKEEVLDNFKENNIIRG